MPILRRTAMAFANHPEIRRVRVIIHPADRELYEQATAGLGLLAPVFGGASRQETVRIGLQSLAFDAPERVLIHDGVRPFVTHDLMSAVLSALDVSPGAIAALPVHDTLKREAGGHIAGTVDRTALWRAQTPQAFRFAEILAAHLGAQGGMELTDDASVAEAAGLSVRLVQGSEDNFKITTEADLVRAEAFINRGAGG